MKTKPRGRPINRKPLKSSESSAGRKRSLAALKKYEFKKGQSGNPKGRTPKHETLTSLYKEEIEKLCPKELVPKALAGKTWKQLIVIATMRLAIKGNATALKECWDRIDGKVTGTLEVTGKDGDAISIQQDLSALTLKELLELQRLARKTSRLDATAE